MSPLSRLSGWLKRRLRFRPAPPPAPAIVVDLPAAPPAPPDSAWTDFPWPPGVATETIRAIESSWRADEARRHRELATQAITHAHLDFARRGVLMRITIVTAAPPPPAKG